MKCSWISSDGFYLYGTDEYLTKPTKTGETVYYDVKHVDGSTIMSKLSRAQQYSSPYESVGARACECVRMCGDNDVVMCINDV